MTIYQRTSGGHVAESLRPVAGSPEAVELAALAEDPASGWRAVATEPPAAVEPEPSPDPVEPVGPTEAPEATEPPVKSAAKAEWVAYAVIQGAEEAEAEAATKDDLIRTYGGGEVSAADQ
ncbi:hypothetical protein ACFQ6B_23785 [Streptomyces wedmorensis]|uniref:Uncharacterized protein n=1 Tax=Streptomyces wedmorensis TaxID=43759 RepID=A0ABW6J6H2_STRWE